jgi:uncharacterized coiled-coil protein SlyX
MQNKIAFSHMAAAMSEQSSRLKEASVQLATQCNIIHEIHDEMRLLYQGLTHWSEPEQNLSSIPWDEVREDMLSALDDYYIEEPDSSELVNFEGYDDGCGTYKVSYDVNEYYVREIIETNIRKFIESFTERKEAYHGE